MSPFGHRLRSHINCNPIELRVLNACDVIILQIACSIYVLSTLHASHHLYQKKINIYVTHVLTHVAALLILAS